MSRWLSDSSRTLGSSQRLGTAEAAAVVAVPDLKVNDVKLRDWFANDRTKMSRWAKQNFDLVNKTVQRGIFEGLDTETIAAQIIQESRLAGFKGAKIAGDTAAARVYRQAQTLARTAVAEQNHQINARVWDANKEAMEGVQYEWVAALDSRTCEICAPMDGRITDTRDDQEDWPIHPNCRCQVVPFDPNGPDEINVQEVSDTPFTYKGKTLDEMNKAEREEALSKGGLYASKVKVKGKMYRRPDNRVERGKNRWRTWPRPTMRRSTSFLAAGLERTYSAERLSGEQTHRRRWRECLKARVMTRPGVLLIAR